MKLKIYHGLALALIVAMGIPQRSTACDACNGIFKQMRSVSAKGGAPKRWSDPATWGGQLPQAGESVRIPAGTTVLLDIDTPALNGLGIDGELIFDDSADRKLTAHYIAIIGGLLQVGTEQAPFQHKATITLTGTDENENIMGVAPLNAGTKFLMAELGGRLELHGARRSARSWTRLAAHGKPGDAEITVIDDVSSWRVGDRIAIAPSGFDPNDAEDVVITSINGTRVGIAPALRHRHWGEIQTIEGCVVDQRAEVALITRDIVVQGADDSVASDFGGHTMIMPGGTARVEGVLFYRMGQKGKAARYPMHWHLVDRLAAMGVTGAGQYARNNSVFQSFHRAFVIHGTHDIVLSDNVAYDVFSHMYVIAEDGDERRNEVRRNIGILMHTLDERDFAFPDRLQNEFRPGIFWMKSPGHEFIGNVAAGAFGNGFFFDGETLAMRPETTGMVFRDNVAHSIYSGRAISGDYDVEAFGNGLFARDVFDEELPRTEGMLQFERFLAYKCGNSGIWIEGQNEAIRDSIVTDSSAGIDGAASIFERLWIIGQTANDIGGHDHTHRGMFVQQGTDGLIMRDITFIDIWDAVLFEHQNYLGMQSELRNIRMIRCHPHMLDDTHPGFLMDSDGTFTGLGVPAVISAHALSSASVPRPEWRMFVTPAGQGSQPTTKSIELIVPRENEPVGHEAPVYVMPRILGQPFEGSRPYWDILIDGRRVAVVNDLSGQQLSFVDDPLAAGPHELTVRLLDASGNPTGLQDTHRFIYGNFELAILSPVPGARVAPDFDLSFGLSGMFYGVAAHGLGKGALVQYSVDGAAPTIWPLSDPIPLRNLSAGAHTIRVSVASAIDGDLASGPAVDRTLSVIVDSSITPSVMPVPGTGSGAPPLQLPGATGGSPGSTGGASAGSSSGGNNSAGSSSGGGSSGGASGSTAGSSSGGGSSGAGSGSGGGTTGAPGGTIEGWTIRFRAPEDGDTVVVRNGQITRIVGFLETMGTNQLPRRFTMPGLVEVAAQSDIQTNLVWAPAQRIGKATRRGRIRFAARKVGRNLPLNELVTVSVRASTNYAVATTETNWIEVLTEASPGD